MNIDIEYFKTLQNASGCKDLKQQKVADTRRRFANNFDSSIGVEHQTKRNDIAQEFIITPTKEKNKCAIFSRPGEELNIGDIIYWNNIHWLVIDKDFQDSIYNSGTIVRCNRIVKWQNSKTGKIIERWCLCTKPYTSNVDSGNVVSVSNREYKIQVSYDEETCLLDLGKRFFLEVIDGNPKSYSITSVDTLTNRYQDLGSDGGGFIVWNLTQDQAGQDGDNTELMICNYVNPDNIIEKYGSIEVSGNSELVVGGTAHSYSANFYSDDSRTKDNNAVAVWNVVLPNCSGITYNIQGNSISFAASNNTKLIGESIYVTVVDAESKYDEYSFTIDCVVF